MQKGRVRLGDRFVDLGLITEDEVRRALAFQREHGGFFGDALVALGLLTPDQVRWGLADQFDIPFAQIRPEHIDPQVAATVGAGWAREHLVLPVLRDGDTVTVVLADPTRADDLDEVRVSTGATRIEVALSAASTIRELIDYVHGDEQHPTIPVWEWLERGLAAGATRLGISARGEDSRGWAADRTDHCRLPPGSVEELARLLSPAPPPSEAGVEHWTAVLTLPHGAWLVDCTYVRSGDATEWAGHVRRSLPSLPSRVRMDHSMRETVTDLLRQGGAVLKIADVEPGAEDLAGVLLAALPAALGTGRGAAVHVADRKGPVDANTLSVIASGDVGAALHALEALALSAVSLDVEHLSSADLAHARITAPLVVFRVRGATADELPADVQLRLRICEDEPIWELSATRPTDRTLD